MRVGYHPRKKEAPEKNDLKKQGFYLSRVWRRIRIEALQRDNYLCQNCLRNHRIKTATEVHHIKPLADYPELGLELDNLESLCWQCHEETKERKKKRTPQGVRIIKVSNGSED